MPDSDRRSSDDNSLNEDALPVPIQVFLWRQISPFVKPKLSKLHEASCMFCQHSMTGHHELKEACKMFERVLVQNIQIGLKPDLSEAIRAIPRWKLIQASLPHVMHSAASLLFHRLKDGNIQSLGAVETKLMYTLHWILLDAAEECADSDFEKGVFRSSPFFYLFSIPTITLFVYLFAPICNHLKESDFQNYRLENGLKVWQAMWEFRHPETACFTSHCKPKPKYFPGKNFKQKTQFGDVFLGQFGFMQHWYKKFARKPKYKYMKLFFQRPSFETRPVINMAKIQGGFYFLLIGYCLATIVFCLEWLIKKKILSVKRK